MRKIPTIFRRNPENMSKILNEPHPDCLWVFKGEGVATRKYDGTCVLIDEGEYYKRREVKPGKSIPNDFIPVETDEKTGKIVGWVPVGFDAKEDRWHVEAFKEGMPNGTYELVGPKIQGNPEKADTHRLIKHSDATPFYDVPRDFKGIANWLVDRDVEGIVFHHPDGRRGKIKKRDFGFKRK